MLGFGFLGRLTTGFLHRLTLGREACDSVPLSARLLPTMSRGHLPNGRALVAGLGCFCEDHTGAAPSGGRPVGAGAVVSRRCRFLKTPVGSDTPS